jgi:hypothetical protein
VRTGVPQDRVRTLPTRQRSPPWTRMVQARGSQKRVLACLDASLKSQGETESRRDADTLSIGHWRDVQSSSAGFELAR